MEEKNSSKIDYSYGIMMVIGTILLLGGALIFDSNFSLEARCEKYIKNTYNYTDTSSPSFLEEQRHCIIVGGINARKANEEICFSHTISRNIDQNLSMTPREIEVIYEECLKKLKRID